jgi:hypothetical protein
MEIVRDMEILVSSSFFLHYLLSLPPIQSENNLFSDPMQLRRLILADIPAHKTFAASRSHFPSSASHSSEKSKQNNDILPPHHDRKFPIPQDRELIKQEEEVFHFTYFNDQVAQTAVGALRPYFIILLDDNVPANHAGNKRQRQSQGQEQGRPPPPPPSVSHMYDFALSDNPSQNRSYPATHGMTQHHTQMGVPGQPGNTYVYVPSPAIPAGYGTGREMIASSMPLAHTIPPTTAEHNHISPTTTTTQNQITPIAAEPINNPATQQSIGKAESPPATESLVNVQDPQYTPDGQSQFIETQQSVETSSGSSRAPNTSLPISNNQDSQVIETQQDKTRSSTVIEGDLLNIYDDDLPSSESGGLQINHPPLDPYEGTPWARSRYRDDEAVRPLTCQLEEDFYRKLKDQSSQVQGRPNQYIDAGVYSMTEDQLDGMIGEIVLEAGFQSFVSLLFHKYLVSSL